ncbi:MAG TPA: crossover junction endodeoxyribonuclease RuvC [Bacteroidetes bacterium]|nr:crossover junction endodeoxyribonuclease RuvC [Bacteroidota bacterium]
MTKINTYRLIGVDPGSNVMGFAVIEIENKKMKVLEMGAISMTHFKEHTMKLKMIFEELQLLIEKYGPKEMAIEAPFYGKNVQSMLKLGRAQGVAMAAAMTKGVSVTEYSPKKIKQSVTGNGNASKEQVAAMLENILKVKIDNTYLDATDALSAAVCHYFQSSSALGGKKKYSGWSAFLKDNPGKLK